MRRRQISVAPHRIAVYLDLENLFYEYRQVAALEAGLAELSSFLARLRRRGTVVAAVAACDRDLQKRVAIELDRLGIRPFRHRGGPDAADKQLLDFLRHEVPASCQTVIIGSGDHIFAEEARRLRQSGKRVEVIAPRSKISAELYKAADSYEEFALPPERKSDKIA